MRYSANSPSQMQAMLEALGLRDWDQLYESIPPAHRCLELPDLEGPIAEGDLQRRLERMAAACPRVSLLGAGLYQHFIPAAARSLCRSSKWLTAYTPYQPEISQGTLMMYYEFQTWVALLTGQEIANGGMYDGSTALAEAAMMARRLRRRAARIHVSEAVHPQYRAVLETYMRFQDVEVSLLPVDRSTGRTIIDISLADQRDALAIVLQSPNFFGLIEDAEAIDPEALLISVVAEAQSMALLDPLPAAISVGEMQSLGIPIQLGGPTAGFLATRREWVRQLPGRLVARTRDNQGRQAFCITLATREQFIRRGRATSNICTSSGLMCLYSAVYMALLGSAGLRDVAQKSVRAAHAFLAGLQKLDCNTPFEGSFFNEFVVDLSAHPDLHERLKQQDFIMGVPISRWYPDFPEHYLIALTERHYPLVNQLIQEVQDCARGN